jgi:hypothetical protein
MSSRKALAPYPGSQKALAFVTALDNVFGFPRRGEIINRIRHDGEKRRPDGKRIVSIFRAGHAFTETGLRGGRRNYFRP